MAAPANTAATRRRCRQKSRRARRAVTSPRRLLHRGNFRSARDLAAQVRDYIDYYNRHHAKPYRWTYTGQPLVA